MYSALKKRLPFSHPQPLIEPAGKSADQLRAQIAKAEEELEALREQLAALEPAAPTKDTPTRAESPPPPPSQTLERFSPQRRKTGAPGRALQRFESAVWKWPLREDEYERYARQLILPQVGIHGNLLCLRAIMEYLADGCEQASND